MVLIAFKDHDETNMDPLKGAPQISVSLEAWDLKPAPISEVKNSSNNQSP
ncbi:hypothetical protein CIP107532_02582 [Corynebacterium diphtheriae]|nr:hypothetical protein CIP107532_02582 [Corynebacterium diphtheriae]